MRARSILISVLLLVACATSPPIQFFTLDPVPAQSPASSGTPLTVQVAAVHIPAMLDRQEMVRRTAANTIEMSDQHRWAAPFAQMTQRVLTQDLAQRLPAGAVIPPDQPAPPGTARLVIDILQFAIDANSTVVFDGSWSLLDPQTDSSGESHPLHWSEQADAKDYPAQARAMSRIIGRIADAITAQLAGDGDP